MKNKIIYLLTVFLSVTFSVAIQAGENTKIDSFITAKNMLMSEFYNSPSSRYTIYCDAQFDENKNIKLPSGFDKSTYSSRASRVEFEHVVPASWFGNNFSAWKNGHAQCVDSKGKSFKGRKCAEQVSDRYNLIQSDSYNLFASIGSVNALRSSYDFEDLPNARSDFGSCDFRVDKKKAHPPEIARGIIGRTFLYMEMTYPEVKLSSKQKARYQQWDQQYPVTEFECVKGMITEKYQGNENPILKQRCGY